MWHVYVLKCTDQSFYVGCTSNFTERLARHGKGQVSYTSSRLPVEVQVVISFRDKYTAFEFEKYLKSGSGRAFMYKRFLKR